ncbi:DUF488 family protein [Sulfolobus acidocaldarius]|uniref:Conserved Archaeal protein n=4 Tax=Sulfolobus acidocaldarius TaxID=2285 RepID=Q4J9F1_SULAC|nr:DUF488 domain-containing protein [Sulfolobus acidocaldarius]AAY80579.1 conserved Archaeal protein [Sulfolobus acidocaldarius DSM 639]AGE71168.1 hypothetical protein SacN8_06015 [Sulfolobus acidocaldarius N8]AGE73438.1 hypothetical protein SacRon12I_06010 [Sulfolobus acidocaldarius Ron12/I]ALU28562.1 hypothetical protein ATY89_00335 [Sulfolobus acidocaldarius]ALU31274.1 hypothetical protein ATZ20_03380 [Sulfolobus acidocaldarius]
MTTIKAYTIGHSNRTISEFLNLLSAYKIEVLIDVRRWPRSKSFPHFNKENLSITLEDNGIQYIWFESLGGYRRFGKDIKDDGIGRCFKDDSFRAFATYILKSVDAKKALEDLLHLCSTRTVAIMCAESLPWNCHRKIISDWLYYKSVEVIHVLGKNKTISHKLTECARIENGELKYL